IGHVIDERDLLGDPERVMPRQHHYHRAEERLLGAPGHVGEKLNRVGTHRVIIEMMLDRPDRIEAERLSHLSQANFILPDFAVGKFVFSILKNASVADVHRDLLLAPLNACRELAAQSLHTAFEVSCQVRRSPDADAPLRTKPCAPQPTGKWPVPVRKWGKAD